MKVAGMVRLILLSTILSVISPQILFAQIGLSLPQPPQVVHLFQPQTYGLEYYQQDSTFFQKKPAMYKRRVEMDSTGQFISISEGIDQTQFLLPAVVDLNTYIRMRSAFDTRELFKKSNLTSIQGKQERSSGAIELDIPFRIKSKAFTRIFGSDRIGLRVTGNISFDLSGRTEERSGSAISAIENQNTFSPRFRQTQQFTVEGKIGDKVTVSVEQNSEATVDIENTLKLRYDGGEDEIVQKIEAGNISLSLPSTKYVIFGGSNQGLFGLKTQMQVGNLYFTAIASLEKGQQQELSINGGASESNSTVKDYEFIRNRYFFADNYYRETFEDGLRDNPTVFTYSAEKEILQLEVWQSSRIEDPQARKGIAVLKPQSYWNAATGYQNVDIDLIKEQLENKPDSEKEEYDYGYFKLLEFGKDYSFDKYRGFFTLNQNIDDMSTLAIAYAPLEAVVSDQVPTVGTMSESLGDTLQPVVLRIIKPRAMQPTNVNTWPLMMRNIYSLGGTKIEKDGFKLRLENNVNGDQAIYPEGGGDKTYLNLMGLDVLDANGAVVDLGDEEIDNNPYIINLSKGTLMFPALEPFNPKLDSRFNKDFPAKDTVAIYNKTYNQTTMATLSKFEMQVTSTSTRSTFDLGFYVLEGSEVVTVGGQTMVRDIDYTIDYFSGQLTLISPEAKRSSSQLQIKYERANLFQLDKKTIFGGRMEYRFWENSFIGLTALYLNKTTLDRRVRVGQEPFSNFVWDINAAFKFTPRIITKALNALPIIETNAESKINIEGEFAQVLPNPNSLNNSKTGDTDGVAYVDDFESSKRTITLGIRYRNWTMASAPRQLPDVSGEADVDEELVDNARKKIAWFNPYSQTFIKDIWPNRDVNQQTGQTTDVLGIDIGQDTAASTDSSWAGIMRSTINFADQQKTKYIELWVQGFDGTMNIDIGRISEDWYINGTNWRGESSQGNLNTEDVNINGLLELEEDIGVDGIPDGEPGDIDDNWEQPEDGALVYYDGYSYDHINGTEGNHNSRDARYPDTEDLDGDGQLSTTNDYFEYSFPLDSTDMDVRNKYVRGSTEKGWRLFRIPIRQPTRIIGNPDPNFQQIFFVRLWFSNLPVERRRIKIATFDFVGNEWEETGVANGIDSAFVQEDSLFTLATYNTEENADPPQNYTSPPGVSGVRDRITKAVSKEQSLVMSINELKPGQVAEAKKTLFSNMDLLNYKNLRLFVHGDETQVPLDPPLESDSGELLTDSSKVRFYLRFGSDGNNYYEYGQDIYAGWHDENEIDIDLDEMAAIKSIDSLRADSVTYRMQLHGSVGAYYKTRGTPNLKNIRYFIIGAEHLGDMDSYHRDRSIFTGEIWLDELRLSNVRRERATALRLSANVSLADIMSFSAQWESKDADFHNISTQFGSGDTRESQNYRGKITLDKFLPDSWDLSIPIDGNASFTRNVPKYKPKTDELTGYSNDTFSKKMQSLFGTRSLDPLLEDLVSSSEVMGWGTTIRTRTKSKRWYLRYTIDEMSFDFDYSRKKSSNWETIFNKSEQYKESFNYNIPFGKNNYFQPLGIFKNIPVLKLLADQKLYYSPQSVKMSLSILDQETKKLLRREGSELNRIVNTSTNRSINGSYTLIPSLKFSYTRNHKTDADFIGLKHENMLKEIFTNGNFGKETDVTQSFKGDFRPTTVDWLKPNYGFSNNFSYGLTNGYKYRQASNRTGHQIGLSLSPGKLLKVIYTPKSRKSKTSTRRGSTRRGRSNQKEKQEEPEKETGSSFPNPLMILYDMFAGWNSVKTTITRNETNAHQYLSGMPNLAYQFGLTKDPGIPQDQSLTVQTPPVNLIGPNFQTTTNIRTQTSLNLTSYIKTTLSHDYSDQESKSNFGQTRSGSRSSSYFNLSEDPMAEIDGISGIGAFIPDWSVNVSKIEKLFFFPSFAKTISLEHGHSSKYSEKLTLNIADGAYQATSSSFSNNWQPLVGVTIRTKWGVNANIRMSSNTSFSSARSAGSSKSETDQTTFSLKYQKSGGFKIPIPVWPFKGKTFKNEMNFNLTFDTSSNRTFQKQFDQKKYQETQQNSNWKLRPSATYKFSSRVQGSMFYERGSTKNKVTGKYGYNEFGITVNIAIHD